jgi:hypothetical protein
MGAQIKNVFLAFSINWEEDCNMFLLTKTKKKPNILFNYNSNNSDCSNIVLYKT